mgnify:CR=1 FL=1
MSIKQKIKFRRFPTADERSPRKGIVIKDTRYSEEHIKQMTDPRHNQWGANGLPENFTDKYHEQEGDE